MTHTHMYSFHPSGILFRASAEHHQWCCCLSLQQSPMPVLTVLTSVVTHELYHQGFLAAVMLFVCAMLLSKLQTTLSSANMSNLVFL